MGQDREDDLVLADSILAMSARLMEEQQLQQLRLNAEAAALGTEIKAAVAKMEAATVEGDRAMYTKIYDNLVADKRELNVMRAALTSQLAGWSVVDSV